MAESGGFMNVDLTPHSGVRFMPDNSHPSQPHFTDESHNDKTSRIRGLKHETEGSY